MTDFVKLLWNKSVLNYQPNSFSVLVYMLGTWMLCVPHNETTKSADASVY